MKLFICEKPSQAKDIAASLGIANRTEFALEGNGIVVTWCVGHLLELAPPDYYCPDLKPKKKYALKSQGEPLRKSGILMWGEGFNPAISEPQKKS